MALILSFFTCLHATVSLFLGFLHTPHGWAPTSQVSFCAPSLHPVYGPSSQSCFFVSPYPSWPFSLSQLFKNPHPRIWFCWWERERENIDERIDWCEKNINQLPPGHTWLGDWTWNLVMCPDRELNPQFFGAWDPHSSQMSHPARALTSFWMNPKSLLGLGPSLYILISNSTISNSVFSSSQTPTPRKTPVSVTLNTIAPVTKAWTIHGSLDRAAAFPQPITKTY